MTTCSICHRDLPADTDRYACAGCEHGIRYTLRGLVADLPLLRAALIPGSRGGGRQPIGRAHSPIPVNLFALDLLGPGASIATVPDPHGEQSAGIPLGAILAGWAHCIAREHQVAYRAHGTEYRVPCTGAVPRTGTDIAAWCRWLLAYLGYAVTRPWVAEMHDELARALARVRAITGTEPRTHPRLAPCPAPSCGAFAMAARDGRWEIVCEACGHQMEPDAYAAHAAAVLPGLTAIAVRMAAAEASAGAA